MSIETLFAFALVHLLAAASPGPNFFLVSGLAGRSSRQAGLLAAAGITLSVLVWSSCAALGLNLFLDRNPTIYAVIQYIGAAYLIWLGVSMVSNALTKPGTAIDPLKKQRIRGRVALRRGFFVNLANPKTVAYYTSIFAVFIPHGSAGIDLGLIVLVAAIVSGSWWCTVAIIFSIKTVRLGFLRISRLIDLIAGGAFVLFGIRLATR